MFIIIVLTVGKRYPSVIPGLVIYSTDSVFIETYVKNKLAEAQSMPSKIHMEMGKTKVSALKTDSGGIHHKRGVYNVP